MKAFLRALLCFCLCILGGSQLIAQNDTISYRKFAPAGAQWSDPILGSRNPFFNNPDPPSVYTATVTKDTVINGILASFIEKNLPPNCGLCAHAQPEIVYDNGAGQIFYWIRDSFYLLYDFTVEIGDTLEITARQAPEFDSPLINIGLIVTEVGPIDINGVELIGYRTRGINESLASGYGADGWVYELLGNQNFLVPFNLAFQDGGLFNVAPYCYSDSNIIVSNEPEFWSTLDEPIGCDLLLNENSEFQAEGNIRFYPNPTFGEIAIDGVSLPTHLIIRNSWGRKIYDIPRFNGTILNLSDLPPGIYFMNIASTTERMVIKL